MEDAYLKKMKEKVETGVNTQFTIREDGMLVIGNCLYVSNFGEFRKQIMEEEEEFSGWYMLLDWCWSTAKSRQHHVNMPRHFVKVLERTT